MPLKKKPQAKTTATPKKVSPKRATPGRVANPKAKKPQTAKLPLNDKQRAFAAEYLVDLNGTKAAIRAGYSPKGAEVASHRLLRDERIQSLVDEARLKRAKRTEITQDRILQELARVAFVDIRGAFNDDGALKRLDEIDEDTIAAIAGLEIIEEYEGHGKDKVFVGYTKKVKIADKLRALEMLCRHQGMFKDKVELGVDEKDPLAALLRQIGASALKPRTTNNKG